MNVRTQLQNALDLINQGSFVKAIERLQSVLAKNPTDLEALYLLSIAEASIGKLQSADSRL